MSFASDQEDDQPESQVDENQQGGTGLGVVQRGQSATPGSQSDISLGGGGSGVVSPGGGNVGGASAPNPSGQPSNSSNSTGSWTNLQSYLNANAGQGDQVGSQIASTVGGQAQTAKNDVDSAASDFQNNVDANTVNADPDLVNKAITDAENAGQSPSSAGGASGSGSQPSPTYSIPENGSSSGLQVSGLPVSSGDPTSVPVGIPENNMTLTPSEPNEVSGFQSQENAAYNGPTDFTKSAGYGQAQNDINSAQTALGELGSESGRDVLLQNQYSGASANGYNQGEKNLDQALLEGSPQAQSALQGVQSQWSGIGNILGTATNNENSAAANAVSVDAATSAAAKAALAAANNNFQNTVTGQLTSDQQSYSSLLAEAQKDLQSNTFTPAVLQALGLSQGEHTYGADPSQFFSAGVNPTLYNTANAQQYAEATALANLAGGTAQSFLPSQYESQAGTASPFTFNNSGFNNAIQQGKTFEQSDVQNLLGLLNAPNKGQSDNLSLLPGMLIPYGMVPGSLKGENLQNAMNVIQGGNFSNDAYDQPLVNNALGQWTSIQDLLNSEIGQSGSPGSNPVVPGTPAAAPARGVPVPVNAPPLVMPNPAGTPAIVAPPIRGPQKSPVHAPVVKSDEEE